MPKKRKSVRKASRPKTARRSQSVKSARFAKNPFANTRAFQIANNLVLVAVLFILVNAVLVFVFPDIPVKNAAAAGIEMSKTTWIAMAVIWVLLAALVYLDNKMVQVFGDKHQMWGLLILGVLMGLAFGRIDYGISAMLVVLASLTYMVASRKGKAKKLGKK